MDFRLFMVTSIELYFFFFFKFEVVVCVILQVGWPFRRKGELKSTAEAEAAFNYE